MTGQPRKEETIGPPELGKNLDRTAGTGPFGQVSLDRSVLTNQPGQDGTERDSKDRTAVTGHPGHNFSFQLHISLNQIRIQGFNFFK